MGNEVGMIEMNPPGDQPDCSPVTLSWTPASSLDVTIVGENPINVVTGLPISMDLKQSDEATTAGFNRSFFANLNPQQRWLSCVNSVWRISLDYGPMIAAFDAIQSFSRGIAAPGISTNWSVNAGANMFGSINVSVRFSYELNNRFISSALGYSWAESCTSTFSITVQGDTTVIDESIRVADSAIGGGVGVLAPIAFPGFPGMPTQITTARTATGPANCGTSSCTWPVEYTNNVGAVPNSFPSSFTYPYFGPGDYGIIGGASASAFNDSDISVVNHLNGLELVTSCSVETYTP